MREKCLLLMKPPRLLNYTILFELRISHLKKELRILENLKQVFREVVACISELKTDVKELRKMEDMNKKHKQNKRQKIAFSPKKTLHNGKFNCLIISLLPGLISFQSRNTSGTTIEGAPNAFSTSTNFSEVFTLFSNTAFVGRGKSGKRSRQVETIQIVDTYL